MGAVLYYFFLILLSTGVVFFYLQYRRSYSNEDALLIKICCGLVFLLLALRWIFPFMFFSNPKVIQYNIEKSYMKAAGQCAAEYITQCDSLQGKKKILVIDYPGDKKMPGSVLSKAILEGMKEGLKSSNFEIIAVEHPLPSIDPKQHWLSASEFDRMIALHPDAELVVSMVGLPKDLPGIKFWQNPDAPKLILIRGGLKYLQKAFEYKVILAAIVFSPGCSFKEASPQTGKKASEAIKDHFLFVTPDNIGEIKEAFPNKF